MRSPQPGLVLVSCNVHRSMELDLLVVPTLYAARVAADGSFTLSGSQPGRAPALLEPAGAARDQSMTFRTWRVPSDLVAIR